MKPHVSGKSCSELSISLGLHLGQEEKYRERCDGFCGYI